MPHFSEESEIRLATCDVRLQDIFHEVIKVFDCTIICGHRGEADQNAAVASGKSHTPYPTSKHNSYPSMAVDVAPWPIEWENIERFRKLNEVVQQEAGKQGIAVKWGGDFLRLRDYDHWELASWKLPPDAEKKVVG